MKGSIFMIDLEERFDTVEEMTAFFKSIVLTNIYNDVAELQQKVTELEAKTVDTACNNVLVD